MVAEISKVSAVQETEFPQENGSRQKGFSAYVDAMLGVLAAISAGNKGNAAELNAESSKVSGIQSQITSLNNQASEDPEDMTEDQLDALTFQLQIAQNGGKIVGTDMSTDSVSIMQGEQQLQIAAANGYTMVNQFAQVART